MLQKLINHLRLHSHTSVYSSTMTPAVAQQIISSMNIIMGKDGTLQGKSDKKNDIDKEIITIHGHLGLIPFSGIF